MERHRCRGPAFRAWRRWRERPVSGAAGVRETCRLLPLPDAPGFLHLTARAGAWGPWESQEVWRPWGRTADTSCCPNLSSLSRLALFAFPGNPRPGLPLRLLFRLEAGGHSQVSSQLSTAEPTDGSLLSVLCLNASQVCQLPRSRSGRGRPRISPGGFQQPVASPSASQPGWPYRTHRAFTESCPP